MRPPELAHLWRNALQWSREHRSLSDTFPVVQAESSFDLCHPHNIDSLAASSSRSIRNLDLNGWWIMWSCEESGRGLLKVETSVPYQGDFDRDATQSFTRRYTDTATGLLAQSKRYFMTEMFNFDSRKSGEVNAPRSKFQTAAIFQGPQNLALWSKTLRE